MTARANVFAFAAGALFGAGLLVSGMTQPAKVQGFLDLTGSWDPSLILVMAGAIAVYMPLYRLIRRRTAPLLDTKFYVPTRRDIDSALVLGAALFGIGWGMAGYCPGPGLVAAASGLGSAVVFVMAMTGGMLLQQTMAARKSRRQEARQGAARPPTTS